MTVTGVPVGGSVRVLQTVVDYASADVPLELVGVTTLPASEFATGSATLLCDNSRPSFVRTEVLDSGGMQVAFSNPVWLLRSEPPDGIPAARSC